jgi:hypothetical protein
MLMPDPTRPHYNQFKATHTLTRNNMELAAIVVYFFSLTVLFALSLILMLFQTADGTNARAANDHHPKVMVNKRNNL